MNSSPRHDPANYAIPRGAAASRGINRPLIEEMVASFYREVKSDRLLGPVFAARMGEDWDAHLEKMGRFWATVLLAEGSYNGNPMHVHRRLPDLSPELFRHWLELFSHTVERVFEPDAAAVIMAKATRMARALSGATLGAPCV